MATDVARLALAFDVTGAKRAQSAMEALRSGSVQLTRATDAQVAAQFRLNSSFQASAVSSRRMAWAFRLQKGAIQQAGYQIGDFATQVSAGQSAIVAFGQQASQLAGIMGPGGALLGAVIAIGSGIAGAFARSMMTGSESTEELVDKTKELVTELGKATDLQRQFINAQFQQSIQTQKTAITEAEESIRSVNARLEDFRRAAGKNVPDAVFNSNSAVQSLRKKLTDARLTIDNANASIEQITKQQREFWEEVEKTGKKTDEATDKVLEMVQAAERQAATIGLSARATATYEAALAGANAEQILAIDRAYQKIEAYQKEQEAIKQARKEEQQRLKEQREQEQALAEMRAMADPAMAEFNRYADQIDQIEQFNISAAEKERLREAAFAQHQERMAQIAQQGNQTQLQNQQAFSQAKQNLDQAILSSTTQLAGNIAGVVADMAGRQSDAYRIAFLAQQGFAIATSIINTQMAAVAALAPPPIGLGPVAGVPYAATIEALGAANIGVIAAQTLVGVAQSYDGGGFTGYGSRSGGIDGKGGFPAILHPNETVIDHTRGQGMGGGVVINIVNAPQGTRTETRQDSNGRQIIDVFIADMATGGPMSKSMQSTFGLRRQGR